MKIAIGSDHGGYRLKVYLKSLLEELGYEVIDVGCQSESSVDYPDFASLVCESVLTDKAGAGILVCGTGIGMSMAANRQPGIRAALCHNEYTARMSREHNDANVLCLGERVLGTGLAESIVRTWLQTTFAAGRHVTRIEKFDK
ncbi:MAG: ribose 5-phosphate isomerase B [Desulfobulbaceae bacterium]|nr:MAG: ribose 5-phosphate isomerase B [Desulfobulbaceae bacterium]